MRNRHSETTSGPARSMAPVVLAWAAPRPRSLLLPLLLLLALASCLLPGRARAEGIEVAEVRTDNYPRVIIRFTVNGADGLPVTDLKPGQLEVFENGVQQGQVDFYSLRESSPDLWLSLVMDVSGSMNDDNKLAQAQAAAKAFVGRLRPRDRTSIVTFSDKVVLQQQPTGDVNALRRAIDGLQAKGPTRMNDGLARGIAELQRARQGARRAAILLSDGEDTDSQAELAPVVRTAAQEGIPIYTIGLGADARADVLRGIAAETGGRFYAAPQPSDLDLVFRLLSGQLSGQYEAWWQSTTEAPAGASVEGQVRVVRAGMAPQEAPFSYIMPAFRRPSQAESSLPVGELREVPRTPRAGWPLPPWWPLLAAVLAAAGAAALYYGAILRLTRTAVQRRLELFVRGYLGDRPRSAPARPTQRQRVRPLVLWLARLSHRLLPTRMLDDLRHRLVLAGRSSSWHFSQFLAAKLLLAAALGTGGYALAIAGDGSLSTTAMLPASLALLGFYLPHLWLGAQIRARQKAIQRALPDSLDLLTVGVSAGLSLDAAILELVERLDNPLTQEFASFLAELRMGRSRREALRGLEVRTGVEDVRVLVASLLQAEELGMSISETLTVQADQMRIRRRQRAEEQAHKATVKMLFPMAVLIFPALFIVIMGPAIPSLLAFMRGS